MESGYYIQPGLGSSEQLYRNLMRQQLEGVGFIWNKTSGTPADQMWNIDNWPTVSLQNIIEAYNIWGGIIAELHNQKAFNPSNTQHMSNIRAVVEAKEVPDSQRAALEAVGFIWHKTAGNPADQMWNIDNWPEISLNNIAAAYNLHGQVIVQLHNEKKFNPDNTKTMAAIQQVINANQSTGGNGSGSNGSGSGSGSGSGGQQIPLPGQNMLPGLPQNIPGWVIPAGIGGLALIIFSMNS